MKKQLGIIVKVQNDCGMDKYTLDNGFSWNDSKGRHELNDIVSVTPYIMGTVQVAKLGKAEVV